MSSRSSRIVCAEGGMSQDAGWKRQQARQAHGSRGREYRSCGSDLMIDVTARG